MYHKGLNHDFAVIKASQLKDIADINQEYIFFYPKKLSSEIVQLHDNLIDYFSDSLIWLKTINPHMKNQFHQGLCSYGDTVFNQELVTPFKELLTAWRLLFSNAPSQFILTGNWMTIGDSKEGQYEKINIHRDELLQKFDKLIAMCEQVEKDDNLVLLHGGI